MAARQRQPQRRHGQPLMVRAAAIATRIAGAALATWALTSSSSWTAEGFPHARMLLPLTVGFALLLTGTCVGTTVQRASAWIALLLAGQAASLRLVQAGTALHYQHLLPWHELPAREPLATAIVGAQLVVVLIAVFARRRAIAEWVRRSLGWRGVVLIAIACVLSSATVSASVRDYAAELALASLIQASAVGTIALAVAALPASALQRLSRAYARLLGVTPPDVRPSIDRFAVACAVAVTAIAALLCAAVYERHPHVQDEVAYLFQARYFAEGLVALPAPPVPEAFELFLLEIGPRGWYSVFAPGWPLVLAAGEWLGAAWLVNPVLGGVNVVLAYLVVWHLYDRPTARLAALLLSASPWHVYLAMSFMPHQLSLTCLLIGVLAVIRARVTGRSLPAWIGGGAIGFLTLVRQLDGFVVAVLLGLWAIGLGGRRLRPGAIAGFVAGLVIVAGVTLPYNRYFTGRATAFPVMTYFDRQFGVNTHAYGFGPERGMGWGIDPFPGHGPVDAVVNANLNTTAINAELFGWATGSLLPIFLFAAAVVAGRGRIRDWRAADRLSVVLLAAVFGAYFFNYFSGGPDFGARYWFLTIVPCVVLTVRGLHVLAATMASAGGHGSERMATAALALSAAAVLVFVPWRALDKYHHYLNMRADVRRLAQERGFGRSVVFIRGKQFPDYASAAIYNPFDLRAPNPVYVHDRSSAVRSQIQAAYPDRLVWVVDGPSLTDAGFRIVAGPFDWSRFFDEIIKVP